MHGYSLGKFLQVVDCIDRKRTRVDDDWTPASTGEYQTYGPVHLREPAIRDAICFLVKGASRYVICRDDLREALQREQFQGLEFGEVRISK